MSEKPEALRFEVWRDRETEILRVTTTGEFVWHKDADAMIADPGLDANPTVIHLLRALRRAEAVQAENERLRGLLEKIVAADDDPNDKLTYIRSRLLAEIKAALRREDV